MGPEYNLLVRVVCLLLALVASASAQGFDPPLHKQTVDYGPPPDLSDAAPDAKIPHDILTCFYYHGLMVKQLTNDWNKGAKVISFLRFDHARPACTKEQAAAERVVDWHEWIGYFRDVKGDLVFIDSDDGWDGGMPFAVYDSKAGKKIFEDSYYDAGMWNPKLRPPASPFNDLRVRTMPDGNIVLTYLRVVGTECDIQKNAARCWPPLAEKFGLKRAAPPRCTGYEEIKSPYFSSVAYPVETSLLPKPTTKTIAGPVKCLPAD